ncbi:TFIIH transcription factor, partial [Spraguea lophii 42_110]
PYTTLFRSESICACHLEITKTGYLCPVCNTKLCYLPIKCTICATQLVSTLNLTKSLFYYQPLKPFNISTGVCKICNEKGESICDQCKNIFCYECDKFLHENINFCPFCSENNEI